MTGIFLMDLTKLLSTFAFLTYSIFDILAVLSTHNILLRNHIPDVSSDFCIDLFIIGHCTTYFMHVCLHKREREEKRKCKKKKHKIS